MKKLPGSSLVEILVATLVVGLALTSIVFLMSINVKTSQDAELRAQAIIFSQQGIDLVRNQRTLNTWQAFVALNLSSLGCNATLNFAGTAFTRVCTLGRKPAMDNCPAAPTTPPSMTACSYLTDNECRLRVIVTWTSGSNSNSVCTIQDFWNR